MRYAVAVAVLAFMSMVQAQQQHPQAAPQFSQKNHTISVAAKDPYASLFKVQPLPRVESIQPQKPISGVASGEAQKKAFALALAESRLGRSEPCRMPLIVVDPKIDPKMVVTIPPDVQKAAKIRTVETKACR